MVDLKKLGKPILLSVNITLMLVLWGVSLYVFGVICMFMLVGLAFDHSGESPLIILMRFGGIAVIPVVVSTILTFLDVWLRKRNRQAISFVLLILSAAGIWGGFALSFPPWF